MSIHQIRLAGPWELLSDEDMAAPQGSPPQIRQSPHRSPARCQLPYDAEVAEPPSSATEGRVILCRRFHKPAGLGADTEVRLVFTTNSPFLHSVLNQHSLADQITAAVPIAESDTSNPEDSTSVVEKQGATAESPAQRVAGHTGLWPRCIRCCCPSTS